MSKRNIYRFTLFLSCVFVLIFVGIGILLFYKSELNSEQKFFEERESKKVELLKSRLISKFDIIVDDLNFVKNLYDNNYFLSTNVLNKFLHAKPSYDSIIFMEIGNSLPSGLIFVSRDNRGITENEQSCIDKTLSSTEDIFYISKLEPFSDQGVIDTSKPEICIGSSIYQNGNKVGVLALNYIGTDIIDIFDNSKTKDGTRLSLFDENGYWLYSNYKALDWAFAYENRLYQSFKLLNSKLWNEFENKYKDQFYTEEGLYTLDTIELPDNKKEWKIVSFVPTTTLYANSTSTLNLLIILDLVVIIIVITFFLVLTRVFKKREEAERQSQRLYKIITIINKILRHDLANILTGINVAYDMYSSENDDSYLKEGYQKSREGIELINRMRRLEDLGREGRNLEHIDLHELINKVSQRFDIPIAISGHATVLADTALDAVIYNIIQNAIKHGKTEKMEIEIDANHKRYVEIVFRDFGIGIDDEIKDKIFEEGFKYRETGNTGIGLYIVRETIEGYGGSVTVEDTKSGGATFVITMPRV